MKFIKTIIFKTKYIFLIPFFDYGKFFAQGTTAFKQSIKATDYKFCLKHQQTWPKSFAAPRHTERVVEPKMYQQKTTASRTDRQTIEHERMTNTRCAVTNEQ